MIADVGGVPVEEVLPTLAGGLGTGLLLMFTWVVSRVRHPRAALRQRSRDAGRPSV